MGSEQNTYRKPKLILELEDIQKSLQKLLHETKDLEDRLSKVIMILKAVEEMK